jgi:Glycosyl hydrolase family 63 C-terminal domain
LILSAEELRLLASQRREENWHRWGPYLSERQWGTVREDYSDGGDATWSYFPHDHARSRAFRWGEDGLLGICDRECRLCFSVALWNGRDPIMKERLFGVTGPEGNHGEDVKENYYYVDSTPTHSYMEGLYKYPQMRYPYEDLVNVSRSRSRKEEEYELADTGAFDDGRYFDVQLRYAKAGPNDILVEIEVTNQSTAAAVIHVLPQLFFRNTWIWGNPDEPATDRPKMWLEDKVVRAQHKTLGEFFFACEQVTGDDSWPWLFTDNETNIQKHPGLPSGSHYFKDAINNYVVLGDARAINPLQIGTKCAPYGLMMIPGGMTKQIRLRLTSTNESIVKQRCGGSAAKFATEAFDESFDEAMDKRKTEADDFYARRIPDYVSRDRQRIMRQAYAGLLWTKQFYHYVVADWLDIHPDGKPSGSIRRQGRNSEWRHLFNRDIISMPDKWEYPWYAAWDLAFHMIPMASLDIHFAKEQMLLFLREWYMHPNGQIPAYEWQLSDVNPPVHAWGVWQIYKATGKPMQRDTEFLARAFQKLLVNFTWWVNRKDPRGKNIFSGGFLGMDNIGVFDRSKPLPQGHLEQADGTAWMAFYCASMLRIAIELAPLSQAYGDMASKFFEHYVSIAQAMNTIDGTGLWDETDGFYYDHLFVDGKSIPIRIRSLVGLLPLMAGVILEDHIVDRLPGFRRRMEWFLNHNADLPQHMTYSESDESPSSHSGKRLLAIPSEHRFQKLLKVLLDEKEFLSPFGIRSLSAAHSEVPFRFDFGGVRHEVSYVPGESDSGMFGGNSNWRGPIWFPMNYLLIQSLKRYHAFYGDQYKVEFPTGSGVMMSLLEVSKELESRLISLFEVDRSGNRPIHGGDARYRDDPAWRDLVLFHEYFHADNGKGLGASHQTGWTALVASMLRSQANVEKFIPIAGSR